MTFGGSLPTLTVMYNGLVNGDTPATFNSGPNVPPTITAPATDPVGTYPGAIVASGASDPNYSISYAPGTLQVTAAPLTITGVSVQWGSESAPLQTASDGVHWLPAGRHTDLPWDDIRGVTLTLASGILTPSEVSVTGLVGGNYGPVTISGSSSGSATVDVITFSKPIAAADLLTITLGSFTRQLDVLPGDVNDDGVVNTTDGVLILQNTTPTHPYQQIYDFNGDGAVNATDFTLYRPFIGTVLPGLPQQLAAGGEGPGSADVLTQGELSAILPAAINEWAAVGLPAANVARLQSVTAEIATLPPSYLGAAAIGASTIYLSADAAGYGWFVDAATVEQCPGRSIFRPRRPAHCRDARTRPCVGPGRSRPDRAARRFDDGDSADGSPPRSVDPGCDRGPGD